MDKKHLSELDPELFTYELYESNYWSRLGLGVWDNALELEIRKHAIGWCPSERLTVRPRKDSIAVMCEDEDGEKFWFHYSKSIIEK